MYTQREFVTVQLQKEFSYSDRRQRPTFFCFISTKVNTRRAKKTNGKLIQTLGRKIKGSVANNGWHSLLRSYSSRVFHGVINAPTDVLSFAIWSVVAYVGPREKIKTNEESVSVSWNGRSSFLPGEKEVPRWRSRLSTLDNEIPATPARSRPIIFHHWSRKVSISRRYRDPSFIFCVLSVPRLFSLKYTQSTISYRFVCLSMFDSLW